MGGRLLRSVISPRAVAFRAAGKLYSVRRYGFFKLYPPIVVSNDWPNLRSSMLMQNLVEAILTYVRETHRLEGLPSSTETSPDISSG